MVFAKYLDDAMVPEWKRAYIDYRVLKDCVAGIHDSQAASAQNAQPPHKPNPPFRQTGVRFTEPSISRSSGPTGLGCAEHDFPAEVFNRAKPPPSPKSVHAHPSGSPSSELKFEPIVTARPRLAPLELKVQTTLMPTRAASHITPLTPRHWLDSTRQSGRGLPASGEAGPSSALCTPITPSRLANSIWKAGTALYRAASRASIPTQPNNLPLSLSTLVECLPPSQRQLVRKLDGELQKVENFYILREREAMAYGAKLLEQTTYFSVHCDIYNAEKKPRSGHRGWSRAVESLSIISALFTSPASRCNVTAPSASSRRSDLEAAIGVKAVHESRVVLARSIVKHAPADHKRAQRKLKRLLREHYRVLEALNNYRILNLMGFRKVLGKFDNTVKPPLQLLQDAYMREKVEPCIFAQGYDVQQMLKDVEERFVVCFSKGDPKAGLAELRQRPPRTMHHLSVLLTGALLGLSLPALASGVYHSFQPEIRARIPGWDALLLIYGALVIPVLLLLLVGTSILVWARMRINYVFIFELDPRHVQDCKKYFELPALLLATLCYSFWLSFAWPDYGGMSPQTWPIVWLLFTLAALFNPLPTRGRAGRFWFARNVARLAMSGWNKVRFAEFWLSAQIASLSFTLGNVYHIACSYRVGFEHDPMTACSHTNAWAVPATFAALPLLVRFVQCIRRHTDTHKTRHLWNAGKYGVGIAYYIMYYWWRFEGGRRDGASFILFCLTGTVYAVGSTAWEYVIDWSALNPRARYFLLRDDVLYRLPVYYFALVTNVLARFAWTFYVPARGPSFALRTWIVAMAELFRRWQWNFLRLESEHLGNMDQYRISTRELPIFYAPDERIRKTD